MTGGVKELQTHRYAAIGRYASTRKDNDLLGRRKGIGNTLQLSTVLWRNLRDSHAEGQDADFVSSDHPGD